MSQLLLTSGTTTTTILTWGIYAVAIIGLFYFMAIRPQKKQQKKQEELVSSLETGDSVLTTSGFFV